MADADITGSTRGLVERLMSAFSGDPQNQEELIQLLRSFHQHQIIGADELFMIEGVLQVSDMQVRDIMIPRGRMTVVDHSSSTSEIIKIITESGHSRFPVIDDDKDDIVGVLLAKDLLQLSLTSGSRFEINDYIRPATFIPESKRLSVLLKDFRINHRHMAMIVDEYGGVSGLVTIEDVLEQIVGEIDDEHDDEEDEVDIKPQGSNRFNVRALTPLDDFNDFFKTSFENDDVETIGGYLLSRIGRLPTRGENFELENFTFRVLNTNSRQVHLYQVSDNSLESPQQKK
ncbi:MAG: CBS domain-containing protein [Gammaproteobacteria bacterium]|nr:CBS domain-containing protein [Gammaproteobacteria bacterium]